MTWDEVIKIIITTMGTALTWLFGTWDTALIVLVCFIILDYITGILRAYINSTVSSDAGLKGIPRKSVMLIVLIIAVLFDRLLNSETWVFHTLVAYFYISNEGISLLENCVGLGLPVPEKLKDALLQLKEANKKEL